MALVGGEEGWKVDNPEPPHTHSRLGQTLSGKCTMHHQIHPSINPLKREQGLPPHGGPNLGKSIVCPLPRGCMLVCSLCNAVPLPNQQGAARTHRWLPKSRDRESTISVL